MAVANCRTKLLETPPALSISVAVCAELTRDTIAVNPALAAFAGTVTVADTVTAALLLDGLTLSPLPGAGALNVNVQASVPDPVIDAVPQEIALNNELRIWIESPHATPADAKLNWTVKINRAVNQELSRHTSASLRAQRRFACKLSLPRDVLHLANSKSCLGRTRLLHADPLSENDFRPVFPAPPSPMAQVMLNSTHSQSVSIVLGRQSACNDAIVLDKVAVDYGFG